MQPEDRLDALLAIRVERRPSRAESPGPESLSGREANGDLEPLLVAADRLAELGSAAPSPEFTANLEALFLARAAYLRENGRSGGTDALPILAPPPLLGNDDPTLPSISWGDDLPRVAHADRRPGRSARRAAQQRTVWRRLLWPAVAAMLLLAIGMTTFTAAAAAGPGSPLYGLHRWEQDLQVNIAGSATDRTRLHLGYAQDALNALNAATSGNQVGATYDDALATFRDEMRAAEADLDSISAGSERNTLSDQLERLRAQGREDLRSALPMLPWSDRVETTGALAELGDNVLQVTWVDMVYTEHSAHGWKVTVFGSGFQPGALLLVNGTPAGTVISVTPTQLVAQLPGDDFASPPANVGAANPDDTAALTTNVTRHELEDNGTPDAQQTPGSDDHTDDHHDGSGSNYSATPTSTPRIDH